MPVYKIVARTHNHHVRASSACHYLQEHLLCYLLAKNKHNNMHGQHQQQHNYHHMIAIIDNIIVVLVITTFVIAISNNCINNSSFAMIFEKYKLITQCLSSMSRVKLFQLS